MRNASVVYLFAFLLLFGGVVSASSALQTATSTGSASQLGMMKYTVGGCQKGGTGSRSALGDGSGKPEIGVDPIIGASITLYHELGYSCCADIQLEYNYSIEGERAVVNIFEVNKGSVCKCMCTYPINASIGPMYPNKYLVRVYGVQYEGSEPVLIAEKEVDITTFIDRPPEPEETGPVFHIGWSQLDQNEAVSFGLNQTDSIVDAVTFVTLNGKPDEIGSIVDFGTLTGQLDRTGSVVVGDESKPQVAIGQKPSGPEEIKLVAVMEGDSQVVSVVARQVEAKPNAIQWQTLSELIKTMPFAHGGLGVPFLMKHAFDSAEKKIFAGYSSGQQAIEILPANSSERKSLGLVYSKKNKN